MKSTPQKCAKILALTFGACLFSERCSDTECQFANPSIHVNPWGKHYIIFSRQYFDLSL